ncbi:MAG: hypothetical protein JW953_17555, partial [Anaerolineae bacterium]|nr:hypothetical protein [Anaerolineae bacterium]
MFKQLKQILQQVKIVPLLTIGAVVAVLATAGSVGAAPALRQLFAGPPPAMINYQGVVQVGGTPYNGTG